MLRINDHYRKLQSSYLFADIARRVARFEKENPDKPVIRLGIGDVVRGLCPAVIKAFHKAVDEMADDAGFRGYGPEQGYAFLRETIAKIDFQDRGCDIAPDEIFISDGSKCDTGNFQELFDRDIRIGVPDPVYPVYVDTNVMAGRTLPFADGRYGGLTYLEGTPDNGFSPDPPDKPLDLIYLCFPNNPTGVMVGKDALKPWVDYARENKALILFDAAYEAFISDDALPHSIYEVEGAREVAVEFRSFSKTAGFTGIRCAYTVVPKELVAYDSDGGKHSVHALWNRRHTTKFNGVAYPVQRAAEAVYSDEGRVQVRAILDGYMANAREITEAVKALGFRTWGGVHSPYVWVDGGRDSWEFFDLLLQKAGVVVTPGAGFGRCGEGFIRISAFNTPEKVRQAMARIKDAL